MNDKITGFICGIDVDKNTYRVLMLATDPRYRNRGIGSKLLNSFEEVSYSRGASKIVLEVRKNSEEVIGFYRKREFKIVEYLKDFYTDGEDGYKMEKCLRNKSRS